MNTYQRQLLDKLITELTAITSPNLHIAQMLAAELKGAMQASPEFTLDTLKIEGLTEADCAEPTPDADGWVENTGVMPECEISAIKYKSGRIEETTEKDWHWTLEDKFYDITHYKPA